MIPHIPRPHDIVKHVRKGVIHIGANIGQERDNYGKKFPVLWIEPQPQVFETLKTNVAKYPNQQCLKALIGEESDKEVKFFTANQTVRSSMYEFTQHHHRDPYFKQKEIIKMRTVRMDKLIDDGVVDLNKYDVLVTDVQGADYDVVKSFGDYIMKFRFLCCEVMIKPIYKNIALEKHLTAYLQTKGFKLITDYGLKRASYRDNIYFNLNLK